MQNRSEKADELLRFQEAAALYTREIMGNVLNICTRFPETGVSTEERRGISEIYTDCCRLIRNQFIIGQLIRLRLSDSDKAYCCSFSEVYENCLATVHAICSYAGKELHYRPLYASYRVPLSTEKLSLIILLPAAIALREFPALTSIDISVAKKRDRVCLRFDFADCAPDFAAFAAECGADGYSDGIFSETPMLASLLCEIIECCGGNAEASSDNSSFTVSIPLSEKGTSLNSPSEAYIANRFSLPYIILCDTAVPEI